MTDAPRAKTNGMAKMPPKATAAQIGEESDSDVPLDKKLKAQKQRIENRASKEAKQIRNEEGTGSAKKTPGSANKRTPASATKKPKKEESDDDETPLSKKRPAKGAKAGGTKDNTPSTKKKAATQPAKATKAAASTPIKKGKGKAAAVKKETPEAEEEEDEEEQWWNEPMKGDNSIKWKTLEHSGVTFPPAYQPLPNSVKLKYDGVPLKLHPEAEEIATFYGSMLHSKHNVENATFNKNFFEDFSEVLNKTGHGKDPSGKKIRIKQFEKCDFKDIFSHFQALSEAKKSRTKDEKKAEKVDKEAAEKPFQFCKWDGKTQKVGNFRVEPPSLFRGRGAHPKTGRVKKRVLPEQITINISKDSKVPDPPAGHKWKEVKHDQTGTWLATWQENINGAYKYVMLAANSDIKGKSDFNKFEKARQLKKHIDRIRGDYEKGLKNDLMEARQLSTAMYLIDRLALRAGNEKGEDEAETAGCCSLKYEHITLKPPNIVCFDFLGKDSIRFHEEVEVDQQVFKNLKIFKKAPKCEGDDVFDRLTTDKLNKHLRNYMEGLTAKVFRTYNASWTMSTLLKEMNLKGKTIPEKVKDFNEANRRVAILCNHKRTVTESHGAQMEKMGDRINGLRYQQWRLKQMIIDLDPKQKKKKGADYFQLPDDLTQSWIQEHQAQLVEEQRKKIEKKFEKDNEKAKANGEKEMKHKELEQRLEVANDMKKMYDKENKKGKVEAEGRSPTVEKFETNIQKLDDRIKTMKVQAEDKEGNKEVALGTSKIVSISGRFVLPRIVANQLPRTILTLA